MQSKTALEESERRSQQLQQELYDVKRKYEMKKEIFSAEKAELSSANAELRMKIEVCAHI